MTVLPAPINRINAITTQIPVNKLVLIFIL